MIKKKLTDRQLETIRLIAEGHCNKIIGRIMKISPHTVKNHLIRIYHMLDLSTAGGGSGGRFKLAAWYWKKKMLEELFQGGSTMLGVKPGLYEHYKGKHYRALGVAIHTETEGPLVIYKAVDNTLLYARPVSSWNEIVQSPVDGAQVNRFRRIGE